MPVIDVDHPVTIQKQRPPAAQRSQSVVGAIERLVGHADIPE